MENFKTPEEPKDEKEVPAFIKKIKNYSLAATIAISSFLASCGSSPHEKHIPEKIASTDLELVTHKEGLEKITPDMLQHTQDLLGKEGIKAYLSERNEKEDHTAEERELSFIQNDSTYILTWHEEIFKGVGEPLDTIVELRDEYHGTKEVYMNKGHSVHDYYVEVDKKSGVVVSFKSTLEDNEGVIRDRIGYWEGVHPQKVIKEDSAFYVVTKGGIAKKRNYKENDAVQFIHKFDGKVGYIKEEAAREKVPGYFSGYNVIDKKGDFIE